MPVPLSTRWPDSSFVNLGCKCKWHCMLALIASVVAIAHLHDIAETIADLVQVKKSIWLHMKCSFSNRLNALDLWHIKSIRNFQCNINVTSVYKCESVLKTKTHFSLVSDLYATMDRWSERIRRSRSVVAIAEPDEVTNWLVLDDMIQADHWKYILSTRGLLWIKAIHAVWLGKRNELSKATAFVKRWASDNGNWSALKWDRIIRSSSFSFPDETSGSWPLACPYGRLC